MKGLPKRFATADDIRNCYEMTKTGEIAKADLLEAMEDMENQNYIQCSIFEITGKKVKVGYVAEAVVGEMALCEGTEYEIETINHISGGEEDEYEATELTLSSAVPVDAKIIGVPAPYNIYDQLGMSKEEYDEIKVDLAS